MWQSVLLKYDFNICNNTVKTIILCQIWLKLTKYKGSKAAATQKKKTLSTFARDHPKNPLSPRLPSSFTHKNIKTLIPHYLPLESFTRQPTTIFNPSQTPNNHSNNSNPHHWRLPKKKGQLRISLSYNHGHSILAILQPRTQQQIEPSGRRSSSLKSVYTPESSSIPRAGSNSTTVYRFLPIQPPLPPSSQSLCKPSITKN